MSAQAYVFDARFADDPGVTRTVALALALLLFDPDGARRRRKDRCVAVIPADPQTWRLIPEDLLHNAPPRRLRDAL
jgi:hypothetical protein